MATLLSAIETQARRHLLEPGAPTAPGAIVVTNAGTPAASTWTYKLVVTNPAGASEAGVASTTATGNATLGAVNYNTLTWSAVPGATGYQVYRTAVATSPTTTGKIATLAASTTSFNDIGVAGDNVSAPTSSLSNNFWSSLEIIDIINQGIRDLWRDIADLKQEHFLANDIINVTMAANTGTLSGVPANVHKVYLIEPTDAGANGTNKGLVFQPRDYNHKIFQSARTLSAVGPNNNVIYYAVTGAGAPTGESSTVIYVSPHVDSLVPLRFVYVPTLTPRLATDLVPIPGEADNALIAWTVAFARAKEREDRGPDPGWLTVYSTEKQHMMQSLGQRQYQEPSVVDALYEEFW